MPDIFISYARKDLSRFVASFHEHLKNKGYDIWIDQNQIEGGADWEDEIYKGVKSCKYFLPIVTPNSYPDESEWVTKEIKWATEDAEDEQRTIIPIILEDADIKQMRYDLHKRNGIPFRYSNLDEPMQILEKSLKGISRCTDCYSIRDIEKWIQSGRQKRFSDAATKWSPEHNAYRDSIIGLPLDANAYGVKAILLGEFDADIVLPLDTPIQVLLHFTGNVRDATLLHYLNYVKRLDTPLWTLYFQGPKNQTGSQFELPESGDNIRSIWYESSNFISDIISRIGQGRPITYFLKCPVPLPMMISRKEFNLHHIQSEIHHHVNNSYIKVYPPES